MKLGNYLHAQATLKESKLNDANAFTEQMTGICRKWKWNRVLKIGKIERKKRTRKTGRERKKENIIRGEERLCIMKERADMKTIRTKEGNGQREKSEN